MLAIILPKSLNKTILLAIMFVLFFFLVKQSFASTTATLYPTSDGTYKQWNPKSGSLHYAMVDETTCDGNTTFNRESSVGGRESYGISLTSIPDGATITQIDVTPCASKNTSGGVNTTFNLFYRLDGVDSADTGSYSLTTTTPSVLGTTTFSGLSASKSGATILEVGGVFSAGNRGLKVSQVSTVITYTLPAPSVTTDAATSVGTNAATLNSTINPNGQTTTVVYRYGTVNTSCSSLPNTTIPLFVGSGTTNVSPNAKIVNSLSLSTTYYFCAVATNATGSTYGDVNSFTTLP